MTMCLSVRFSKLRGAEAGLQRQELASEVDREPRRASGAAPGIGTPGCSRLEKLPGSPDVRSTYVSGEP
jgi:hypothetical protein